MRNITSYCETWRYSKIEPNYELCLFQYFGSLHRCYTTISQSRLITTPLAACLRTLCSFPGSPNRSKTSLCIWNYAVRQNWYRGSQRPRRTSGRTTTGCIKQSIDGVSPDRATKLRFQARPITGDQRPKVLEKKKPKPHSKLIK